MYVLDHGVRRYSVEGQDVDIHLFDGVLNGIDADWRRHLTRERE